MKKRTDNSYILHDIFVIRLLALILQLRLSKMNIEVCTSLGVEKAEIKVRLQHLLHPLRLWHQLGGKFTPISKLYERYCWQPFLRNMFTHKVEKWPINTPSYTCEQCEKPLGSKRPAVVFWAYAELFYFCSLPCRDQWLDPAIPSDKPE
jgi:hypothetical protein